MVVFVVLKDGASGAWGPWCGRRQFCAVSAASVRGQLAGLISTPTAGSVARMMTSSAVV